MLFRMYCILTLNILGFVLCCVYSVKRKCMYVNGQRLLPAMLLMCILSSVL